MQRFATGSGDRCSSSTTVPSSNSTIFSQPPASITHLRPTDHDTNELVERFLSRYTNAKTIASYRQLLRELFSLSGRDHPDQLNEADIATWATHDDPANNTVYCRISAARTFLRWCVREGLVDKNVGDGFSGPDSPLRTYHRTYGKVQAANPGRWLTHKEAYETLIGSCQDGTDIGLRDELALRLGLMGMRLHEICALNIANLRQLPVITWTGKGHKPRKTTAGQGFIDALGHYLDEYRRHVPELTGETPLLCKQVNGTHGHRRIRWGSCLGTDTLFYIVVHRAEAAGLGHVAPHDLRRTAAGILHRATDEHGAHHFDLLDIQKVLGHSDPATTMRSYLEPMNTDVLDRASRFLD